MRQCTQCMHWLSVLSQQGHSRSEEGLREKVEGEGERRERGVSGVTRQKGYERDERDERRETREESACNMCELHHSRCTGLSVVSFARCLKRLTTCVRLSQWLRAHSRLRALV